MNATADDAATSSGFLGGLAQLGRYFQLISIVPAAVVVFTTYALLVAGAPAQRPTAERMGAAAGNIGFSEATALAFAVVVLGMTLHPFQYAMTQFLEGYWGPTQLSRIARFSRARLHWRRRRQYAVGLDIADERIKALELSEPSPTWTRKMVIAYETERLRQHLDYEAFRTAGDRYPASSDLVMPTLLGNRLRRVEHLAGAPYGLNAIAVVPHLMAMAPAEQVAHVNDARGDLDLAVRFVVSWLLLACVSVLLLWPYGPWLAIPIVAYGMAWVSYRAAVLAAEEYGSTVMVLVDLTWAKLYADFRLPDDSTFMTAVERGERISEIAGRSNFDL